MHGGGRGVGLGVGLGVASSSTSLVLQVSLLYNFGIYTGNKNTTYTTFFFYLESNFPFLTIV